MNTSGILRKYWVLISFHFGLDCILFLSAFLLSVFLRFGEEFNSILWSHWPYAVFGALVFSSMTYIFGMYSRHSVTKGIFKRSLVLGFCITVAIGVMIAMTYISFARPF